MILREKIASIKIIRKIIIPILSMLDFDIKIKHDVTKRKFQLKFWSHRGYWYYGKYRQSKEIDFYKKFIKNGFNVLEVGGHIGYVSQFFESLVGDEGKLIVLEPSAVNYRYLTRNIKENTIALNLGASDKKGVVDFYTENFGGFTNSLNKEFVSKSASGNKISQNSGDAKLNILKINIDTIDSIVGDLKIDFVKIDVEGAELMVLTGMKNTLPKVKALMIEISEDHQNIFKILKDGGFKQVDQFGEEVKSLGLELTGNYFYINT